MDHSIFGSLMDINGDVKGEVHSSEVIYIDEQSDSCDPESSGEGDYSSGYYPPLAVDIDDAAPQIEEYIESQRKIVKSPTKKGRNKTILTTECKEIRFKCHQCDYGTWKKSNYERHLLTHSKKLYKCTLCPYSAKHADDLANHVGLHKKEPTPTNNAAAASPPAEQIIEIPQKAVKSPPKKSKKGRIKKKLATKIRELRFKCQKCEYRTWKKSNFQRHLLTHNKKLYKCTLCPFSAKHPDDLVRHIGCHKKKEPTPPKNIPQPAVVKQEVKAKVEPSWNNSEVTQPAVVKQEVKSVKVKVDPSWNNNSGPVKTPNPPQIKYEIKEEPELYCPPVEVHLDEQSSSNSCVPESSVEDGSDSDFFPLAVHLDDANVQAGTVSQPQLKSSEVSITRKTVPKLINDQELRYSCPYCSYRTWKTSNFQRHLCTHTNERPHKCHLCKYSGKHHEDLKKHMLCHNQEITFAAIETVQENDMLQVKRFACLLCDFKTTRSSVLKKHQLVVHNDHRPFACDLCPYRSKQRDSLKKHMMAHTDERPFECDICHHRCRQKGDLKRHKLLHTGERPFACPYCPYRSNRTQLLKKHISRRHCIPLDSSEISMIKSNLLFEEFAGGHYLAEMFNIN